jgi:phosphopantothenoylcysteine decarboxylase / phosphopantothenate---cysteine ligase
MISVLRDKRIVLGVTGSIACYKAVDLASKLTQAGAQVDVILTAAAMQFVQPLTFQAVTGRPVYTNMWQAGEAGPGLPTHIAHVGLGEGADLLAIIPATAHTLARMAVGLADDLLAVTVLAARCPVMVAPAMDGGMYTTPTVQANLETLTGRGVILIEPDEGRFASGLSGQGRLPDTTRLLGEIRRVLGREGVLAGWKVVVSAGGTREAIDPVRYITNHSSGKQGYAIVQAALDAGARLVVLVTASALPEPVGAVRVEVDSAQAMDAAVQHHSADADLLVMAAAVADFRPAQAAEHKIKKSRADDLMLTLTRNPDILLNIKDRRAETGFPRRVVGFAAESQNLLDNARDKLTRKGLDLLVANDIRAQDAGFAVDTNRVVILDAAGNPEAIDLTTKAAIAEQIIQRVAALGVG